jgi:hypothetical protein
MSQHGSSHGKQPREQRQTQRGETKQRRRHDRKPLAELKRQPQRRPETTT